jgi:hypothetical protein
MFFPWLVACEKNNLRCNMRNNFSCSWWLLSFSLQVLGLAVFVPVITCFLSMVIITGDYMKTTDSPTALLMGEKVERN